MDKRGRITVTFDDTEYQFKKESNMIKFNLERALAGDKVVTRDGREVTQLVKFDSGNQLCLYGVTRNMIRAWYGNGKEDGDKRHDLFMAPDKLKGFVNVYTDTSANFKFLDAYVTRNEADICAETGRIACIDLSQFNEGEGL